MHRVLADDPFRPQGVQQFAVGHDFALVLDQVEQHLHRQVLQGNALAVPAQLVQVRLDRPVAEQKLVAIGLRDAGHPKVLEQP